MQTRVLDAHHGPREQCANVSRFNSRIVNLAIGTITALGGIASIFGFSLYVRRLITSAQWPLRPPACALATQADEY